MPRNRQSAPKTVARYSPAEDKRAILLRQVEADLEGADLEPWEAQLCRWVALHPNTKRARQMEVASALAGRDVPSQELVQLRCRAAWKALWIRERDVPNALAKAKADYASLIENSPTQYQRMLHEAVKAKDVRAATPLLVPLLDRAVPKHDDGDSGKTPSVHIHLSVAQQKGLEASPLDVSAEEVTVAEYEVEDVA